MWMHVVRIKMANDYLLDTCMCMRKRLFFIVHENDDFSKTCLIPFFIHIIPPISVSSQPFSFHENPLQSVPTPPTILFYYRSMLFLFVCVKILYTGWVHLFNGSISRTHEKKTRQKEFFHIAKKEMSAKDAFAPLFTAILILSWIYFEMTMIVFFYLIASSMGAKANIKDYKMRRKIVIKIV